MADSLADLFSADSPPRHPPRSPSPVSRASTPGASFRRPNNTLFLSPGGSQPSPARRRRYDEMNTDDIGDVAYMSHDDLGDEPEPMDIRDLERLRRNMDSRRANGESVDAGGRANGNGIGERDLNSHFDDPFAIQDPLAGGGAGNEEPPKKKRPVATVDRERLLGKHGLPALLSMSKRWKPKGKGHESHDLTSVLNMYQMWAHTMYPKSQFLYTIQRVGTIARQGGVSSAIDGIREAFHNPEKAAFDYNDPEDFDLEHEAEAAVAAAEEEDERAQERRGITVVGSTGVTAGPQPLFNERDDGEFSFEDELAAMEEMERSANPQPLGDMDDMDEMAAMAEMEAMERETMHSEGPAANGSSIVRKSVDLGDEPPVVDEEDEWEGLDD